MIYVVQCFCEKGVDKDETVCYNNQAVREKQIVNTTLVSRMVKKRKLKKLKKTFQKPLDKRKEMCYNNQAVREKRKAKLKLGP